MKPSAQERSASVFRTTHWTQVLAACGESVDARCALRELCAVYYGPVESFVGRYRAGHDDARDLTQEFFAGLLEGNCLEGVEKTQGRFRTYLLGAVKHFLSDRSDRESALKRGGGRTSHSLNAFDVADPNGFPPDAYFDRHWALALTTRAMTELEAEYQQRADSKKFEVLRGWLIPTDDGAMAIEAARKLDMSEGAFKVAVHRLRKRFRQLVKQQVAASVDDPDSLANELDYLIQALIATE